MLHHAQKRTTAPPPRWLAPVAGVLAANALPHLAVGLAGRSHLTPLAGPDSGPTTNTVWGVLNAVGATLLLHRAVHDETDPERLDERLLAFGNGAAAMAVWMAASEAVLRGLPRQRDQ